MHNTRTGRLEPFRTSQPGLVRMYVCGPSVYDESHLGHARSYVAYDAMKRALKAIGYRVKHVQNFTDVEENVATRAAKARLAPLDFATRLIEAFFRDMDELRVQRADHYPRVSEHIEEVKTIVSDLEEKGIAYRVDCGPRSHIQKGSPCDVYFSVERAPEFGKLIGETLADLTVERPPLPAGDRKNPLDFALWKSRADWGVTWASPWGEGRPGWHVECTAMSTKYLGADFDIHGGGLDLVFPHHESERAIGEAWTGERYCNYYLHNGFVTVGAQKMSKSLGNFVTIRDLLDRHDPEAIRVMLLSAHYRAALNYDEEGILEATRRVERWRGQVATIRQHASGAAPAPTLSPAVGEARDAFWAALQDDFRFDRALESIDLALDRGATQQAADAAATLAFLREAGSALGVLWSIAE